jgi:hypothetical protein
MVITPRTDRQCFGGQLAASESELRPRTNFDTNKRNHDLFQPLGMLALNRLLKEREHILEDLIHQECPTSVRNNDYRMIDTLLLVYSRDLSAVGFQDNYELRHIEVASLDNSLNHVNVNDKRGSFQLINIPRTIPNCWI